MELLYFLILGLASVSKVSEPPMESSQSVSGWEAQEYSSSSSSSSSNWQQGFGGQLQCKVDQNNVMRTFNGHYINLPANQPTVASTGHGQLDNGELFTFQVVVNAEQGRATSLTFGYKGKHYLYETVFTDSSFHNAEIRTNGGQVIHVQVGETKHIQADDGNQILSIRRDGQGSVVVMTTKEVVYHVMGNLRKINIPEQYIPNGGGRCKE